MSEKIKEIKRNAGYSAESMIKLDLTSMSFIMIDSQNAAYWKVSISVEESGPSLSQNLAGLVTSTEFSSEAIVPDWVKGEEK